MARLVLIPVLLATLASSGPGAARADVLFGFEGPYLRDPTRTIKDHSMVFDGTQWHCFYIRGQEAVAGTSSEQEFGHAITTDLHRWNLLPSVLTSGPGEWDGRNIWAPDVLPSPGGSGWTMLYTGRAPDLLQRMGAATSTDLFSWTKLPENPLLEPDSSQYFWGPGSDNLELSSFRDPFVFEKDGQFHVLNSVLLPDSTVPDGRRGALYHATSPDLRNWTDVGPLLVNNSTQGVWRDIESAQLIERNGTWHLFFTLFNVLGVQWVSNDSFDTGWDLGKAIVIDTGIGAEVTPMGDDEWLFTRHAPSQHFWLHPDAGQVFYTLRADTLRFGPNDAPVIVRSDLFASQWPEREGDAFVHAPTFGDNQLERGEPPAGVIGNGFLSSREYWKGPLSGVGSPGGSIGDEPTGRIRSTWFTIDSTDVRHRFLLGGTETEDCRIELQERVEVAPDSFEVVVRRSASPPGSFSMAPRTWDVTDLRGATVRFEVIDASTTGWISVDHIVAEQEGTVTEAPAAAPRGRLHAPTPNPFNPRTRLGFDLPVDGRVELRIFDLRGRRVRAIDLGPRPAGSHEVVWDGRDDGGRQLASAVYLVRLSVDGLGVDTRKAVLAR